jgi:hypothetical protein
MRQPMPMAEFFRAPSHAPDSKKQLAIGQMRLAPVQVQVHFSAVSCFFAISSAASVRASRLGQSALITDTSHILLLGLLPYSQMLCRILAIFQLPKYTLIHFEFFKRVLSPPFSTSAFIIMSRQG